MLIRKPVLEQIRKGDVSIVFRKWRRPSVKSRTNLKTAIGLLSISKVTPCEEDEISDEDARKAGYKNRQQVLDDLSAREGTIYRIRVAYAGEDPRVSLREDAELDGDDMLQIEKQLDRYDRASRKGAWTFKILRLIAQHPLLPAGDLAAKAGFDKEWLKINIRKLKNLGLTISHQPGYEISPRGREFLRRTKRRG